MRRLGLFILWLCWRLLPAGALGGLGEGVGALLYRLANSRRRIGQINLRLCFPQLGEAERETILRRHFRVWGRIMLLETILWWGSREDIARLADMAGLEHLQPHLGKPLIFLAPHFTGLDLGGMRINLDYAPMATMYAHIKNPHLDRVVLHARQRFGNGLVFSREDGIKPVIRAIKQLRPFYYLPDMDLGAKDAVFVPFFGVATATVTGLSRLARLTGATVVPCVSRLEGKRWVARFYPAWESFPSDDVEADTRRMNAFIEDRVRETPEQYFWLHKRFKTRPSGEPSVYG